MQTVTCDFVIAGQWPNRDHSWPGELSHKNGLRWVREKAVLRKNRRYAEDWILEVFSNRLEISIGWAN